MLSNDETTHYLLLDYNEMFQEAIMYGSFPFEIQYSVIC